MHDLFSIFTLFDQKASRNIRITLYYIRFIFSLSINAIFVYNYNDVQKVFLNIFFSVILFLLSQILILLFTSDKIILNIIGTALTISSLGMCYYSVLVAVSSGSSSNSNQWIQYYIFQILFDSLVVGVSVAFVKYRIFKIAFVSDLGVKFKYQKILKKLFLILRIETYLMYKYGLLYSE